jgi:long-chain acyl-CoA synthetase
VQATDVRPWTKLYQGFADDIVVPDTTMYEQVAESARKWPKLTALIYMGKRLSYEQLLENIDHCAAGMLAQGIKAGDTVTLVMPNVPNTLVVFYALNRIGVRVAMVHPLSSPAELKHYLQQTNSTMAVTMDMFYPKLDEIIDDTVVKKLLICHFSDYLSNPKKVGFKITKGRKIAKVPANDTRVINWKEFMAKGSAVPPYTRSIDPQAPTVILFSGGTTSMPKGVELSSVAFNALALSMHEITGFTVGDSVLAILPLFHGFGLGLCVHTALVVGAHPILVPEFSAKIYIDNLLKHQPSFIAGVPTLFQALLQHEKFAKVSFANLHGAYSGGDSLTPDLKARFDEAIIKQGGSVELMEGYGLTESVTACAISPRKLYKDNSIGVPIPGMLMKVVDPVSAEAIPNGEDGEFCVTGPTLMNGYLNEPEATAQTLRKHADGRVWLHTGDIGSMDDDGYFYFKGRQKRIVKVSGVSVYPAQVEQVLEAHPAVRQACVIGIPDNYQLSALKAFIVLNDGVEEDEHLRHKIVQHCKAHLIKWAVPRTIEFRRELPTTLVGKTAYTQLEQEEMAARG